MKTERDIEIQIAILELEESKAQKEELDLIREKIKTLKWVIDSGEAEEVDTEKHLESLKRNF